MWLWRERLTDRWRVVVYDRVALMAIFEESGAMGTS